MANEIAKISIFSDRTKKLLSRLDNCFKEYNISETPNSFSQFVEKASYKTQITWIFKRSDIEKVAIGKCFKSPSADVSYLNIRYLWLEIYPKESQRDFVCMDLHVCFNNLPENMLIMCDIFVLNNNEDIVWEEMFCGKACDLKGKTIIFPKSFFGFEKGKNMSINDNLFIRCRMKLSSSFYKCQLGSRTHTVNETPEFNNCMKHLRGIKYSDIVLKVGSSNIKSHRCILALKSPAFRILLKLNCGNELELKNEKNTALKDVIDFLYTGNIEILNSQHAWKLYLSAHKYDVLDLRDLCSAYLNANITEKNVCNMLDLSRSSDDEYLIQACLKFIKDHDIEDSMKSFYKNNKKD